MSTSLVKRSLHRCMGWLEERYPIAKFIEWSRHKTVPVGKTSIWYYFGGITLFLFTIQVSTGILLMFYFKGSADTAYESVRFISAKVPFGWLIRSIHAWSANLMILAAMIHMFSVFFLRAYRKPREMTWVTGIFLLGILFGFGFSGYLLPWNELSFFATKVGTDMIGVMPVIGKPIMYALRGGEEVTGSTLPRFFALHVALFPALLSGLILVHLLFIQIQGMHEPSEWKEHPEKRRSIPFFPDFFLRDLLLWLLILDVLAALAVFSPMELGEKADPFKSAPPGIKPEWYFLYMYQFLKFIPARIGPLEGELAGLLVVGFGAFLWFLVPWIDTGKNATVAKLTRFGGILVVIFMLVMTVLGHVLE